jgi:hypothetical protein
MFLTIKHNIPREACNLILSPHGAKFWTRYVTMQPIPGYFINTLGTRQPRIQDITPAHPLLRKYPGAGWSRDS